MTTGGIARTCTGETVILTNQMIKVLKVIASAKTRTYDQVQKVTQFDMPSIYTCAHRLERAGLIWRDTTHRGGTCSISLRTREGVALLDDIRRIR